MLSSSARRFHSLLVLPALGFLFFLAGPKTFTNHTSAAVGSSAKAYQPSSPSMPESHVWVDTIWCYDEATKQSIATTGYLDGGDGSHPAGFVLQYSGSNVTLSFTGPVTRAGFTVMGQAGQQVTATANNDTGSNEKIPASP